MAKPMTNPEAERLDLRTELDVLNGRDTEAARLWESERRDYIRRRLREIEEGAP